MHYVKAQTGSFAVLFLVETLFNYANVLGLRFG